MGDWAPALVSAFGAGVFSGAIPVTVAEATVLAAGAAMPSGPLTVAVLVVFTLGHVTGKGLWYWLGTLESRITHPRLRTWIDRARSVVSRHPRVGFGVAAASATVSVPPFHLLAIAAGMVRTPPVPLFCVAFIGRLIRFGAIAASSSLVRYLWVI